jgi:hypothetical protein
MFRSPKPEHEQARPAPRPLTPAERQMNFFQGTALALIPAMFLLPLWFFLLRAPLLAHGRTIAALAFSLIAGLVAQGVRKLIRSMDLRDLDLTTATAFGVLLVLSCILVYAGLVLFALFNG